MSSKRHSILPSASQSGPKAPVQFSSSITIADLAVLTGSYLITISSESVIHPRARLESHGGAVTIGRRCIIHERAILGALGTEGRVTDHAVTLGDCVTVEVAASIEAGDTVIGDGTTVGVGSKIGRGAVVGKVLVRMITRTPVRRLTGETALHAHPAYSDTGRRCGA